MLPAAYDEKDHVYPVIYFLHGLRGNYSGWQAQRIAEFFRSNAEKGEIPECIVVFPDGKEGFWCNHFDQDPMLEEEIISYLIPHVDQNYRTNREKRIILGWSAGGMGAMTLFSRNPGLFVAAASLDGSIVNWDDFLQFQGKRPEIIGNLEYYIDNCSPHKWMKENRSLITDRQDTVLFLAAGFFAPYLHDFLSILEKQEISFHYQELSCGHEFGCVFSEVEKDLLKFLSKRLQ